MRDRHIVELAWLKDFVALAESGSFSRAAEARRIAQPAFGRRIRALESWVGAALFIRSSSGATLTPAGVQFNHGAAGLIETIELLRRDTREAAETSDSDAITLRFAATHALAFTFFPGWIRQVEQHGPIGPTRLFSDTMAGCEDLMLQGQAQFLLCHRHALAASRFEPSRFRSIAVGMDSLVPLTAPDADGGPRWSLNQTGASLPLLSYTEESGLGRIFAAHDIADRIPALESVFSAQLAATLLGKVREGHGIAWLPAGLAAKDMAAGTLVRAGGAEWDVPIEIGLFRPLEPQSAAAERFWASLTSLPARPA
ncbi:LysR substrate-binding domain-containing protein [Sphingomonas sp. QA11]|uniref:LysR substrate-binding domain-containing protein n=1 Tax=Sphingomonas sp. QA11 TaxID=2950605 RepID=UPI00234AD783|nr:LysR substrate-binding domain-containing protein [Sphingomonas sp. QA11]WCM29432.1 LysR substrate-binding domain-containing protein [Sphingomonas sp. QA11]